MDFNTILRRFGIEPENFINKEVEPIKILDGFIYEVEQRTDVRCCPHCKSNKAYIKDYKHVDIRCNQNEYFTDILRVKKVRFTCLQCGKTYTPQILGIDRGETISHQMKTFIINDFTRPITFEDIGKKYGLSTARCLQLFDQEIKYVPRLPLPEVLCIDEIKFETEGISKYCCVLYDFKEKKIVDIIRSRQMPYLKEYFTKIPIFERKKVKIFISDMYDGYATIKNIYFENAVHVVDNFHVITQLNRAVNSIRLETMKNYVDHASLEYNFMKSKWKYFLCREEYVPDKYITSRKTGESLHYDQMILRCIQLNEQFYEAYLTMQDIYHHSYYSTFEESLNFVTFLRNKLVNSCSPILGKVGETYYHWRTEIANAFIREFKGIKYTNAIAECINNKLKSIIKSAYGYRNFERFRKRALLICTYTQF